MDATVPGRRRARGGNAETPLWHRIRAGSQGFRCQDGSASSLHFVGVLRYLVHTFTSST